MQKCGSVELRMVEVSPHTFNSVAREPRLSDKVSEMLTDAIMSGKLRPGDRLPAERDLGDQFGVSRTVIREAVRSLAACGLVRVTSGRGVEVSRINSGNVAASMRLLVRGHEGLDYGKVHEVRTAVEVQAAGLAALRATSEHLQHLRRLCDDQQRCLESGDLAAASEHDFQFHRQLSIASGNELLVAMLDSISDVLLEVRNQAMQHPHVGEAGIKAHRWILDCIVAGEPDASRRAMEKHLAEAERTWREGPEVSAADKKSGKRSDANAKGQRSKAK
jgi:GntR family transcriptional repressor for pyruvate dehydrogenase complex